MHDHRETMSNQTLSYGQSLLREESRHFLLCNTVTCIRKDHCLSWLVEQWTSDDLRIVNVINPYRKDVVEGNCIDFRSDKKRRMARGMVNFYQNIPEPKAKAIHKPSSQTSPRPSTSSSAMALSPSPPKTNSRLPTYAVPTAGLTTSPLITTMKNMTSKRCLKSHFYYTAVFPRCKTTSFSLRNH